MKYTQLLTIAALTAQAQASCESHVESELATLMDIVESLENEDSNLVSTIQARKDELQRLSEEEPECQQRYLNELESLSNLVDAVEEENFESFVKSLESRKDQLIQSMLISEVPEVKAAAPKRATDSKQKQAYEKALTDLYASLPVVTQTELLTSIKSLDMSYKKFVAVNGKDLRTMSAAQFQKWAKAKSAPEPPTAEEKKAADTKKAAADKVIADKAAAKKAADDKVAADAAYKKMTPEEKKAADKKVADAKAVADKKVADAKKVADDKAAADKKAADDKAVADKKVADEKAAKDKKAYDAMTPEQKKEQDKKNAAAKVVADKAAADKKAADAYAKLTPEEKAAADKKVADAKTAAANKKAAAYKKVVDAKTAADKATADKAAADKKAYDAMTAEEKTAADKKATEDKAAADKKVTDAKKVADKKVADDKKAYDAMTADEKKAQDKKVADAKAAADKKVADAKKVTADNKAAFDKKVADDKTAAATKKAADDKKAAAAKLVFQGKVELVALQKSGAAFETLCVNAPYRALVELKKASTVAYPGNVEVTAKNDAAFNAALVKALTAEKLTAFNKFGTELTAAQAAVKTATPAAAVPFLVADAGSSALYPQMRVMTQAEVDTKVAGNKALTEKATAFKAVAAADTDKYTKANADLKTLVAAGKPQVAAFDAQVNTLVALPAHSGKNAPNALLVAPTTQRNALTKVEAATTKYNTAVAKDDSKSATLEKKHQLMEKVKKNSGGIAIGLGVTALLLTVAGVGACKYKKTCCFKDADQMEGGDRALYKQEFKKSHKKHAKESLVPAFDVQA